MRRGGGEKGLCRGPKQYYHSRLSFSPFSATLMKKIGSVWMLIVFCAVARAQDTRLTATPTPAADEVVRISTNIIQVDVTVIDKSGKVIRDLKPDVVKVYDNGKQ